MYLFCIYLHLNIDLNAIFWCDFIFLCISILYLAFIWIWTFIAFFCIRLLMWFHIVFTYILYLPLFWILGWTCFAFILYILFAHVFLYLLIIWACCTWHLFCICLLTKCEFIFYQHDKLFDCYLLVLFVLSVVIVTQELIFIILSNLKPIVFIMKICCFILHCHYVLIYNLICIFFKTLPKKWSKFRVFNFM